MVSRIIGKQFNRISSTVDMLCLFLGEDYSFINTHGEPTNVAEYSIHFQTQWRFREGSIILLAARDIYDPYCQNIPKDWMYDLTGRPDELSSVFDARAKAFMIKMRGAVVTECKLSAANDMLIAFSNGVVLEQFTPTSQKDEEWRLIDYKSGEHIVCYGENGTISAE